MKGRICLMVLGIMMTVSSGYSYDISAYGYESPLQQAYMESEHEIVTGEIRGQDALQQVSTEHIEKAAAETDAILAELAMQAELARQEEQRQAAVAAGESERDLLSLIVMAEAGCEDLQGQIMVANVVLNRVRAGYGSISDVILAPGQFEPISTGGIWSMAPTASVYEAVDRALAGEDYSAGALFFVSSACDYSWFMEDLTFVTQHGGHLFFR